MYARESKEASKTKLIGRRFGFGGLFSSFGSLLLDQLLTQVFVLGSI